MGLVVESVYPRIGDNDVPHDVSCECKECQAAIPNFLKDIPLQHINAYPDNNPKTAFGALKTPIDLVPPALELGAAEAFAEGAAKYGPFNWRTAQISSSVYYAAVNRHLKAWYDRLDDKDLAPDSKVHHLKHAAACIGMLLDIMDSDLLNDNRPPRVTRRTK